MVFFVPSRLRLHCRRCMLRVIIVLACLVSVQGLSAGSAYGQTQDLSNCKVSSAEAPTSARDADMSRLYGSPEMAVQIDRAGVVARLLRA